MISRPYQDPPELIFPTLFSAAEIATVEFDVGRDEAGDSGRACEIVQQAWTRPDSSHEEVTAAGTGDSASLAMALTGLNRFLGDAARSPRGSQEGPQEVEHGKQGFVLPVSRARAGPCLPQFPLGRPLPFDISSTSPISTMAGYKKGDVHTVSRFDARRRRRL